MRNAAVSIDVADAPPTGVPLGLEWTDDSGLLARFGSLRHLINTTATNIWRFSDLDPHIAALEQMIFTLDDHGLTANMFLASLSYAQVALQQVAYCKWETELEHRFVHALKPSSTIDDYALGARFRRLLEREVSLISVGGRPERLLFIGSGPFPISAILAHEYLGVQVDCVEVDRVAVAQSRRLLDDLRLSESIRVLHVDGNGVDASAYDAVLIALLAKPKHEILAGIAATARPDCRVICRTSEGLRVLVYEPMRLDRDLQSHQVCDKRLAIAEGDTISSLLLATR
jgi:hypothetical protein